MLFCFSTLPKSSIVFTPFLCRGFVLLRSQVNSAIFEIMKKTAGEAKPESHWSHGLISSINDPDAKLEEDDLIVVLRDKYPKARFHYLILPKKNIPAIKYITKDDLNLLRHMEAVAQKYVDSHSGHEFKVGYHAIPSMQRLHLHVISTDFNSPCLKTKHHWNTFTTPFFIPCKDVYKQLEEHGIIKINIPENKQYLKKDLKCHKCNYIPKTMPELKKHLLHHIASN